MIYTQSVTRNSNQRSLSSSKQICFILTPESDLLSSQSSKKAREGLVIKTWIKKTAEAQQSALNELRARKVAEEIINAIKVIPGIEEHLHKIDLTGGFANFESIETLPLVSDFFDGNELNFELAQKLPVELRAAIALLTKTLGINQFPTSSLLIRDDEGGLKVGIIDLESAFSLEKVDITTINCLSLLREASARDGSLDRFNQIIQDGADLWFRKLESDSKDLENTLSLNLEPLINTSSPKDTLETLKKIIISFRANNCKIEEMTSELHSQSKVEIIDLAFINRFIDTRNAFRNLGDDKKIVLDVSSIFNGEANRLLADAKELLEKKDFIGIRRCGHTLKSIIQFFCINNSTVLQSALNLEKAGTAEELNNAQLALEELVQIMPDFCKAMRMFSQNLIT